MVVVAVVAVVVVAVVVVAVAAAVVNINGNYASPPKKPGFYKFVVDRKLLSQKPGFWPSTCLIVDD
jgi:CDP-diacylglycerol pyrophosphatase